MFETVYGAFIIMLMRMCDVSIGTMRTILIVQEKKYLAGMAGFFEVLIRVFAIRFIFQHLDNYANLFGYAMGFGLGNVLGIALEHKIGFGYIQLNIISKHFTDEIAGKLRRSKYGVTILPGEEEPEEYQLLLLLQQESIRKS